MTPDFVHRLRLPVVCAPMFLVSGPEMVVAACKAGIVGAFPNANARPIETLDAWMHTISAALAAARDADPAATIGPWAVNLMTHRSNSRMPEDLALIAKYKPPIVITALGSPKPAIEVVRGYGGIVLADVVNLALARKAVAAGADGLACVSAGAGGHTGSLSPFAFVSAIREFFDGLVVLGGGIADGFGVAGAIAAGADLVYMGTRFIATRESLAPPAYKQMLVDCNVEDLVVSDALTGTPASWLAPSLVKAGLDPANLPTAPERNYDANRPLSARRWVDTWTAGHGVGAIREVSPLAEVVDRLEREYDEAARRWSARLAPTRDATRAPEPGPDPDGVDVRAQAPSPAMGAIRVRSTPGAPCDDLLPAPGTRIVVAGGCGGIGRAFVAAAIGHGLAPAVVDLAASIAAHPPPAGVPAIACDARQESEVCSAFAQVHALWGGACDALVNLVGYTHERTPVESLASAEWDDIVDGTLRSAYLLSREAIPLLRRGRSPAIVHTASTFGVRVAWPGYAPYAASKAGVINLVRALATELAPQVRVNAVAPGLVDTDFLNGGTSQPERRERVDISRYATTVPLGRAGQPQDIVGPMLFLIGPGAAFMTGQTIHANGGIWS